MSKSLKCAIDFARKKHAGQFRKGIREDYINHPIGVAKLVDYYFEGVDNLLILKTVAILHDTLEDTDTSFNELKNLFGEEVANLVFELTNDELKKKKYGKEKYLSLKMKDMSNDALNVKLCDRLYNVKDTIHADIDFRKHYLDETNSIIDFLVNNRQLNLTQLIITSDIMLEITNLQSYDNSQRLLNKKM